MNSADILNAALDELVKEDGFPEEECHYFTNEEEANEWLIDIAKGHSYELARGDPNDINMPALY